MQFKFIDVVKVCCKSDRPAPRDRGEGIADVLEPSSNSLVLASLEGVELWLTPAAKAEYEAGKRRDRLKAA